MRSSTSGFFNLLPAWSRSARAAVAPHGAAPAPVTAELAARVAGSVRVTAVLAVLLVAGVAVLAAPVVRVVYSDPAFAEAAPLLRWMACGLGLAFLSGNFRFAFIAAGRPREDLLANGAGAAVAVATCLVFRSALAPAVMAAVFVTADAVTLASRGRAGGGLMRTSG